MSTATNLVRAAPSPEDVLLELAKHRSPDVREWVIEVAPELLGRSATKVLLKLVNDRDSDVRSDATVALARVDPAAARRLLPRLERRLYSDEFWEPTLALWAIAMIGDVEAVTLVRKAASGWPRDHAESKIAEMVVKLLEGRVAELITELDRHEHGSTPFLAKALGIAGTREAMEALRRCAQSAPDEECRAYCSRAIART